MGRQRISHSADSAEHCAQVGAETFRLCRSLLDGVVLVDNSAISAAIKVPDLARAIFVSTCAQAARPLRLLPQLTACTQACMQPGPARGRHWNEQHLQSLLSPVVLAACIGRVQRDALHPGAGRRGRRRGRQGVPAARGAAGAPSKPFQLCQRNIIACLCPPDSLNRQACIPLGRVACTQHARAFLLGTRRELRMRRLAHETR